MSSCSRMNSARSGWPLASNQSAAARRGPSAVESAAIAARMVGGKLMVALSGFGLRVLVGGELPDARERVLREYLLEAPAAEPFPVGEVEQPNSAVVAMLPVPRKQLHDRTSANLRARTTDATGGTILAAGKASPNPFDKP